MNGHAVRGDIRAQYITKLGCVCQGSPQLKVAFYFFCFFFYPSTPVSLKIKLQKAPLPTLWNNFSPHGSNNPIFTVCPPLCPGTMTLQDCILLCQPASVWIWQWNIMILIENWRGEWRGCLRDQGHIFLALEISFWTAASGLQQCLFFPFPPDV